MPPSKEAPAAIVCAAERTDVPEEAGMSPPEVTVPLPVLGAVVVFAPPPEPEVAEALEAFELVADELEPEPESEPEESEVLVGAFAVVLLSAPEPDSEVLDAFTFLVVEEAAVAADEVFEDLAFALIVAVELAVGFRALSVSLKPGRSSSQSRAAIARPC
jgi:hypothetical protein